MQLSRMRNCGVVSTGLVEAASILTMEGQDRISPLVLPPDLHFASDGQPWQRSLRWAVAPRDRRRVWLGIFFAILITILELSGFTAAMRRLEYTAWHPSAIQVRILEKPLEASPIPPDPEPQATAHRPIDRSVVMPRGGERLVPPASTEPTDALGAPIDDAGSQIQRPTLFNQDGSIRLEAGASATVVPTKPTNPRDIAKARWAEIEKRGNPLGCRKTQFSRVYAPDEDAGDEVARKYLKWVGLADMEAIRHRQQRRAFSGGCEDSE